MGVARAVQIKTRSQSLKVVTRTKGRIKGRTGKLIKLPLRRAKLKKYELTEAQREELVISHRPKARKLARSILRKWHSRLDIDEVDSIVDLSLCEAVRRFRPDKGAAFMTFMYYHLRGNLIRIVADAANQNTVPLFDRELAEGAPSYNSHTASIASAIEVAEALSAHDQVLPDEALYRKELVELSREACGKLDPLEQEIVSRVFLEEEQLLDVAKRLGYSRCHISRVKRKALESLQSELRSAKIQLEPLSDKIERNRRSVTRRGADRRALLETNNSAKKHFEQASVC